MKSGCRRAFSAWTAHIQPTALLPGSINNRGHFTTAGSCLTEAWRRPQCHVCHNPPYGSNASLQPRLTRPTDGLPQTQATQLKGHLSMQHEHLKSHVSCSSGDPPRVWGHGSMSQHWRSFMPQITRLQVGNQTLSAAPGLYVCAFKCTCVCVRA